MKLRRAFLPPEVVQTSQMDCGPAALTALLAGFGVHVNYERLREACQTSVDGTSIDALEEVCNDFGIPVVQQIVPKDALFEALDAVGPALVVTTVPGGGNHFIVAWRRVGPFVLVMDPGVGRRWLTRKQLSEERYVHVQPFPRSRWRDWALSTAFLPSLTARVREIGHGLDHLVRSAVDEGTWRGLAALDAAVSCAQWLKGQAPLKRSDLAEMLPGLVEVAKKDLAAEQPVVPRPLWTVFDPTPSQRRNRKLLMTGAVLLALEPGSEFASQGSTAGVPRRQPQSRELAQAVVTKARDPVLEALSILARHDRSVAVAAAVAIFVLAVAAVAEVIALRVAFEISTALTLTHQRVAAAAALGAFFALLLATEFFVSRMTKHLGQVLEVKLRLLVLERIPRLADRYLRTRLASEMAQRVHQAFTVRTLPGAILAFIGGVFGMSATIIGILLVDPPSTRLTLIAAFTSLAIPILLARLMTEANMRLQTHASALTQFHMETMRGLMPLKLHGAEPVMRAEHDSRLVEWLRTASETVRLSLASTAIQAATTTLMVGLIVALYVTRAGLSQPVLILLLFWVLRLPGQGQAIASSILGYPGARTTLARLLEPLRTTDVTAAPVGEPDPTSARPSEGAEIVLEEAEVLVGGQPVLTGVNLTIEKGEHVAIVGSSGAGKSSLVGVLLGWYQLAKGRVAVDGTNLDEMKLAALRSQTAWIDPAVHLWNRSFLENVTFGNENATSFAALDAISQADLMTVLERLDKGLSTKVGMAGMLLSGGEGQRLRTARAFMRTDARLVILDEAFRGLDPDLRKTLLGRARELWANATLLCVTHDLEATLTFDRVIVVEGGRIVETGVPAELAKGASHYARLLEASALASARVWKGAFWRKWTVEGGRVVERP